MKALIPIACSLIAASAFFGNKAYAVGASVPFTEYEAEAGTLGGGAALVSLALPLSNPSNGEPVIESSGAAYVSLAGTGQSVSWTNNTGQNITALNIRVQIPDAPSGGGITSTIDLYVNGKLRQAINVNCKQTYLYNNNNRDKNPADGSPTRVWDEYPFFVTGAAIAPGSTIMLKKDSANTASFYNIDLIDLETPPAALSQPANSLSITSYGAVANSPTTDNTTAIQNCVNAAQSQGKSVWIPSGTFYMGTSTTSGLNIPSGVAVNGAGTWYSILYSNPSNPVSGGQMIGGVGCTLQNFTLDGNSISAGCASATGMSGSNWTVNTVWVRHLSLAVWGGGNNGMIENMRVNNTWSDGINLNNFSGSSTTGSNLTATNNFLRFTGDDCLAVNGTESTGHTPMNGVTISNNTAVQTAGSIVVYGGNNVTITNNYVHDLVQNDGIQVGYHLQSASINTVTVKGNLVVRCGNPSFGGVPGMLVGTMSTTYDNNGVQTPYSDSNISVIGNTIMNPYYGAFQIQIANNVVVQDNVISSPGLYGINIDNIATGSATIDFNLVFNVPSGQSAYLNSTTSGFSTILYDNNWQPSSGIVSPVASGLYRLVCATSDMAMDNAGSTTAGTAVTQWDYTLGNLNQEWQTVSSTGGYWNLLCQKSGMNLDNGGSTTAGTNVTQWTVNAGNTNQNWQFADVGGGYYNVICQKSSMALDNGGSLTHGTNLTQYTLGSANLNQYWHLETLPQSGHYYHLVCATSGMALDNGGSTTAGTTVTQNTDSSGNNNQLWELVSVTGGYYNLVCQKSGMALDNGGSTTAGTNVTQWTVNSGNINQNWQLVDAGGGYFNVICQKSGMCLDNGGSTSTGTNVTQYTSAGNSNQLWRLEFVR